jgi:cytochrome b subunit of formate dehydrogenase
MIMYKGMLLLPTDLKDIILEQLKVQGSTFKCKSHKHRYYGYYWCIENIFACKFLLNDWNKELWFGMKSPWNVNFRPIDSIYVTHNISKSKDSPWGFTPHVQVKDWPYGFCAPIDQGKDCPYWGFVLQLVRLGLSKWILVRLSAASSESVQLIGCDIWVGMMLVIYCKWTLHNPEPLSHKNKKLCLILCLSRKWRKKINNLGH